MKVFLNIAFSFLLTIPRALSLPLELRQEPAAVNNVDVLQFALTLEHLENVFYKGALSRFSETDFQKAGFDSKFFSQLQFVARDEEQHVVFLQQAISDAGATPVAACEYNFPYTDLNGFVSVASILEGVGVSAYLGGAPVISSKDILTSAGAILVAEGLHQSLHRNALHQAASAKIVGTPATPNSIFTLASAFIASCPPENPPLPFKAFPSLSPAPGTATTINSMASFIAGGDAAVPESSFITFVSGLDVVSIPGSVADGHHSAAIPKEAQGQTFVFITNSKAQGTLTDDIVVAGPAVIEVAPETPVLDSSIQ